MKIFVDENIPLMTVQALRALGYDVLDIRGTADQGMADDALWEIVQREGRILITTDKGFAQRRDEPHHGMVIVCLHQPNRREIHQRVMRRQLLSSKQMNGQACWSQCGTWFRAFGEQENNSKYLDKETIRWH